MSLLPHFSWMIAVVLGSVVGHWYEGRAKGMRNPDRAQRLGVLVASGMIVGESLFGVLNAGLIVATSSDAPIALAPGDFMLANPLGVLTFVVLVSLLYRWMLQRSHAAPAAMSKT